MRTTQGGGLAVIPARGGSKRIPGKNIRSFCGKPMIAWSIEAALSSGCFSEVIVSTDDAEIAAVATEFGASVPFLRERALSDDYTGLAPVVVDTLDRMQIKAGLACCILPTAPFLKTDHLVGARRILSETPDVSMVFGAVRYSHPVQRAFRLNSRGGAEMIFSEHQHSRSQDLEPVFHDAGQFYFFSVPWLRAQQGFVFDGASCIEFPEVEVQDIDTEGDWLIAEIKWQRLRKLGV